jgi:hypothetical protein
MMDEILRRVRRSRARLVTADFVQGLAGGMFWAGLALAVLFYLQRWTRPWPPILWAAAAAAFPLAILARVLFRRPSLRSAALALDRAAGLDERLSAALFVKDEGSATSEALIRDAQEALRRAGDREVPLIGSLRLRRLLVPALLVPLAFLLPAAPLRSGGAAAPAPRPVASLVPETVRKEESERLKRRAFSLEKKSQELQKPELKEIADAVRKASGELRKEEITRNEALAKISSLEEKARGKKDQAASKLPEGLLKRMRDQGAPGAKGPDDRKAELERKLSDLMKAAEGLKEKLEKAGTPEGQAQLDQALKELSEKLGTEFGNTLPQDLLGRLDGLLGQHDPKDLEALAKALGELKDTLGNLELLEALEGELEDLLALKDDLSDEDGLCLLCGKPKKGEKGGT